MAKKFGKNKENPETPNGIEVKLPSKGDSAIVGDISSCVESLTQDIDSALVTIVTGKYSNIKEGNLKTKMNQKNIFLGMYGILNTEIKNTIKENKEILKNISDALYGTSSDSLLSLLVSYLTSPPIQNPETNSKINGILSLDLSNPEALKAWNEFIKSFEDTDEIDKYIANLDKIEKLFSKVEETFSKESTATKSIENIVGFSTISKKSKNLSKDLKDTFDIFEKISKSNFTKEDVEKIKEIIDSMTEVLETSVSNLIKASEKNESAMATLKKSFEETYKIAVAGSEIDKRKLAKSRASLGEIISAITIMGLVMLIGGYIIERNPDLIVGSILFGLTLSTFLTIMMVPIGILSILDFGSSKESMKGLSTFIITASLIMIIGGYFMKDKEFAKNSLLFGATLGAFLLLITFPITILSIIDMGGKVTSNLKALKSFIITSAIIMTIGAFLISSDNGTFVKNALKFGVVLGAFIGLTLLPIFGFSKLISKAFPILKEINWFVALSSLILMAGAAVMKIPGMVEAAFKFSLTLSAFIILTLAPILGFSALVKRADKVLDEVNDFILTSATIMVIGALIVRNKKMVDNALLFGVVLSAFISITLLPILLFSVLVRKATRTIEDITGFIIAASAMLIFGAYIILKKPELALAGIQFGVVLGVFVFATLLPFLLLNKITMRRATEGLLFMGGFILIASISLFIAAYTGKKFGWSAIGGAVLLGLFVYAMSKVFIAINSESKLAKEAAIGAAIMAFTLLEIAVAIFVINELVPEITLELIGKIALCAGLLWAVTGMLNIVAAAGKNAMLASIGIAIMVVSLIGLTYAIRLIDNLIPGPITEDGVHPLVWKVVLVGAIMAGLGLILKMVAGFGVDAILGAASMGIMVVVLGLAAVAIQLVDKALGDNMWDILGKVTILGAVLTGMAVVVGALGVFAVEIALGAAAMAALVGVILLTALTVDYIVHVTEKAKKVEDVNYIKIVFDNFIDVINSIPLNPIKLAKLLAKGVMINKLVWSIAPALKFLAITIADIASLKMAIDWDDNGKPIKYRNLTQNDFTSASVNIQTIITTLASAILEASNYYSQIDTKTLFKTLYASQKIGDVIGSISTGLQSYANLLIPNRWDEKTGKPIHFKQMQKTDFSLAAENIKTIITTMADAISEVYVGREEMFKDASDMVNIGIFNMVKSRPNSSPFIKVLGASIMIGDVINSIATGLQAYAQIMIPTAWNDNGKPIRFRKMTQPEFKNAKINISTILTTLIKGIAELYKNQEYKPFFNETSEVIKEGGLFGKKEYKVSSPLMRVLSASLTLSQVITGLATGVQAFADLKFADEWDKKTGKPIHFVRIGFAELTEASNNIQTVITTSINAVKSAYDNIKNDIEPAKFKEIVEAFVPVGQFIGSLGDGLVKMAELKFPTEYDPKTGKALGYTDLSKTADGKNVFITATENINLIISTLSRGLKDAYDNYLNEMDANTIRTISDTFNPIASFVNTLAENIANYANGTFKDSSGKVIKLEPKDFIKASENVVNIITAITSKLTEYYDTNSKYFKNGEEYSLSNISSKLEDVNNLVKSIIEITKEIGGIKNTKSIETLLTDTFSAITTIYGEKIDIISNKEKIEATLDACTKIFTLVQSNLEFMGTISTYNTSKLKNAKNNILVLTSSVFESIEQSDKTIQSKAESLSELSNKVKSFSEIVRDLVQYGFNVGSINSDAIKKFTDSVSTFASDTNISNMNIRPLERFVTATNSVDIQKASKLTGLMEAMSKLASKMGGFDKLADAIDKDFVEILNKLGDKVDSAKATIEAAERIEKERQEKFNKNLEKISNIMKESISIKVGSLDEDGNLSAGYEKEK